jgi:hypothetical protein
VELFGDVVLDEIVGHFLAVLFHLHNVLALLGFFQGAFSALAFASDSDFLVRGEGGGKGGEQAEGTEGTDDGFHGISFGL